MTTIAYDGRYLAADTQAQRDNNRSNIKCRKLRLVGAFAYAVHGDWHPVLGNLIKWHEAGAKPGDLPQHGGGSLTIVNVISGCVWAVAGPQMPYLDEEGAPWGCGSGGDIALGAMTQGATAMEAVAAAMRYDTGTSGDVEFIDLRDLGAGVQTWNWVMPSSKQPAPLYKVTTAPDGTQDIRQVTDPQPITIHKPRAPEKSASGANKWADACSGRLVLGTGCGACLRCNREWYAVLRQVGDSNHERDITLSPEQVQQALDRVPETVTTQAVDHLLADADEGRNSALERLESYVREYNLASSVGDQHAVRMLDITLRNMVFPAGVELVEDINGTTPRKRIIHAAQPQA
jgi:hypothetical protein